MAESRLNVTVDTAPGEELARRITAALEASLATARAEGVTDDETFLSLAVGAVLHEVLCVRADVRPRECCGHLSPQTLLSTPPVECVLRPGHSGSHASESGMRWYPITSVPAPADVRDQVAAAIVQHEYEIGLAGTTEVRDHHRGDADAVLRVPVIAEALTAAAALARVGKLADDLAHPRHLGQHGLPHRLVADEIRGALDPQEQRATPHDVAHPEGS